MENPFSLTFGQIPTEMISRDNQLNQIIDIFEMERPTNHVFMIAGIRGSGKTVSLSDVSVAVELEAVLSVVVVVTVSVDVKAVVVYSTVVVVVYDSVVSEVKIVSSLVVVVMGRVVVTSLLGV